MFGIPNFLARLETMRLGSTFTNIIYFMNYSIHFLAPIFAPASVTASDLTPNSPRFRYRSHATRGATSFGLVRTSHDLQALTPSRRK